MKKSILATVLVAACSAVAVAKVNVIPQPVTVEEGQGSFTIKPDATTVGGGSDEVVKYAVETMHLSPAKGTADVRLTTDGADASLGDEGYDLSVTDKGVTIKAPKAAGLFYGVQTLRQLVGTDGAVPVVHIVDKPRFPYRGLMLDSGRHIQSVEYVKSMIDRIAELKMNRFHWHLTEDQGWRVEIKKYPKLTEVGAYREKDGERYGGFFTQEQIKDVVAYADARFVTIVPEIEMPGHSVAAVASYPYLGCTGQQVPVRWEWGISKDVYCAGKETTYQFCEDVLTEVMALFPHSPVIHVGGDECPKDNWKKCPDCQTMIKKHGLKDENALQGYFTSRIAHFLADHGRRLQGWNEIMEGTDLPKGVIVQQWNAPHSATLAAEAGLDVVCSPTSHCYFDYPYNQIPTHKVLDFEPVPSDLKAELQGHIIGIQGNLWTEHMDDEARVDYMAWPRTVALAEAAWSPKGEKDWGDFKHRGEAWVARQPEEQRKGLQERLADDTYFGNRIGYWKPNQVTTELKERSWVATRYITGPGTYEIQFGYTEGAHGLAIEQAKLEPGGTTDKHSGFTGAATRDNVYTVTVEKYDPAVKYVVKAKVRSDGGTDSNGTVYIRKVK